MVAILSGGRSSELRPIPTLLRAYLCVRLSYLAENDACNLYSKIVWANRNMPATNTLVQLLTLYTNPESHNAQRHNQTDRQTDNRIIRQYI